ncbi:hypothetical protein QLX08_007224 [Tetragonisca angustula]|uniref:Uncharacterized protein n=1 Tax=Tetragonisca angustula TaxID=166442 RepID=A0AAW0ZT85_9HYME
MENLFANLVKAITQGDVERGKARKCLGPSTKAPANRDTELEDLRERQLEIPRKGDQKRKEVTPPEKPARDKMAKGPVTSDQKTSGASEKNNWKTVKRSKPNRKREGRQNQRQEIPRAENAKDLLSSTGTVITSPVGNDKSILCLLERTVSIEDKRFSYFAITVSLFYFAITLCW